MTIFDNLAEREPSLSDLKLQDVFSSEKEQREYWERVWQRLEPEFQENDRLRRLAAERSLKQWFS